MLFYQPPKSSIWGHSLRGMPAARARALFTDFLGAAVGSYAWRASRMQRGNEELPHDQFEACIQQIIAEQTAKKTSRAWVAQHFDISAWRIHGHLIKTFSTITLYYGSGACISTHLQFDKKEHFDYIRQTLEDLGLCTLNEKYLKRKQ